MMPQSKKIWNVRVRILIWRPIDITQYSWKFDNTILNPCTSAIAPPSLLKSIACKSTSLYANKIVAAMQMASLALHTASADDTVQI